MPGFWDYMKQFSDSQNEKLKTIYDRQFNTANMFSEVIQNQARNSLDVANTKAGIIGKQADIANYDIDRTFRGNEADKQRSWETGEKQYDRIHDRDEAAKDRELDIRLAGISQSGAERLAALNAKYEKDFALEQDAITRGQLTYTHNLNKKALEEATKTEQLNALRERKADPLQNIVNLISERPFNARPVPLPQSEIQRTAIDHLGRRVEIYKDGTMFVYGKD